MSRSAPDEERGYADYDPTDREDEHHALLPSTTQEIKESPAPQLQRRQCCKPKRPLKPYLVSLVSFLAGGSAVLLVQFLRENCFFPPHPSTSTSHAYTGRPDLLDVANGDDDFAPPYVGSTEIHHYPPPSPTNDFPSLFPTEVGNPGPTGTGAEPALVQTAPVYPKQSGAPLLVSPRPNSKDNANNDVGGDGKFDMFKSWGNLSPWYSVERGAFGVSSGPETPAGCTVEGVHILHRHGARYPTEYASFASPAGFAAKLHKANQGKKGKLRAKGDLAFLNTWTYKLGHNVLTPFGRQQLFDLGVSMRLKYGFLLESFTDPKSPSSPRLPIIRTESQDRMLASATNFALGFFGWPLDGKVLMEVTIEKKGVNNTLAPYKTCDNESKDGKGDRGVWYVRKWTEVYLKDARKRLGALLEGVELDYEDVYVMQLLCAYEVRSLPCCIWSPYADSPRTDCLPRLLLLLQPLYPI
jgi:Histidine phosphatase superfamily (branch 2)